MPYQLQPMDDEPILIAHLYGKVTCQDVLTLFAKSAEFADQVGGPIARITVVEEGDISFGDLVMIMAEVPGGMPGSPSDLRLSCAMVGSHQWARFYSDSLHQDQYKRINVPLFGSLDEALAYVRERMVSRV
jgi:hypothetical protein